MNEWGFVQKIKTFEQGRIIFSYAVDTILRIWKWLWAAVVSLFFFTLSKSSHYVSIYKSKITDKNTSMYTHSIHKWLWAGIHHPREHWFVWKNILCVVMLEVLYIVEILSQADWAEKQRGVKLAVTEKMRIWRQGDKEFKQNEACRLAALPSVTGVISWGSLSLCLLPLFI